MKRKRTLSDLPKAAIGIALIAIASWITVPLFPVPFTLQTAAVFTLAGLLGWKWGFFTVAGYLILGGLGLPIFAGGRGGSEVLLGPTGGFLLGLLLAAPLVGWLGRGARFCSLFLAILLGMAVVDVIGVGWFWRYSLRTSGDTSAWQVFSVALLPFLLPDLLKGVLSAVLIRRVRNGIRK